MARLIGAYERSQQAEVGRQLVAALENASHLPALRADVLRPILKAYPPEIARVAEPLLKRLSQNVEQQKARLEQLKPVLTGGDVQRGREMFFGNKAACFACHSVQGHGGHVGPDLSKIGEIRAPPDLLEAIVFPSASFARGFEPYLITTKDEDLYAGIIGRETADDIYLYNSAQAETRIPRGNIKEVRPGAVSVMPEGLDAQLTRQELGDIITFLGSLR
jgi:putative heme-binding domain-containing protein